MAEMIHSWPPQFNNVFTANDTTNAYLSQINDSLAGIHGCHGRHASGNPRCWTICDDPDYTFSDDVSLWECALIPNITNYSRSGELSRKNQTFLVENHVDTSLVKAQNITSSISTCLVSYCNAYYPCGIRDPLVCTVAALTINGSMLRAEAIDSCVQSICASHPKPQANVDFSGIGIVFSYVLGVGLAITSALILILLALFCTLSAKRAQSTNSSHPQTALQASSRDQYEDIATSYKYEKQILAARKLQDALLAALVEFLKAQCFLAMASSIAATIWYQTQQMSLLDGLALMTACNAGIFSVTITIYILAAFNYTRRSWFLYSLVLCTWITSLYATFSIQVAYNYQRSSSRFDDYLETGPFAQSPPACAQWPVAYICPNLKSPDLGGGYSFYNILLLPHVIGVTFWQFSSVPFLSIKMSENHTPLLLTIMHLGAIGLLVTPLFFLGKSIVLLFAIQSIDTTWGFGQVVALTAWIPFITALVNNYLEGIADAHTKQLPYSYSTVAIARSDIASASQRSWPLPTENSIPPPAPSS